MRRQASLVYVFVYVGVSSRIWLRVGAVLRGRDGRRDCGEVGEGGEQEEGRPGDHASKRQPRGRRRRLGLKLPPSRHQVQMHAAAVAVAGLQLLVVPWLACSRASYIATARIVSSPSPS